MRFHLEHESLFFLKVHPKMIERVINESFQRDSVVAMASPVEMGIIDSATKRGDKHVHSGGF